MCLSRLPSISALSVSYAKNAMLPVPYIIPVMVSAFVSHRRECLLGRPQPKQLELNTEEILELMNAELHIALQHSAVRLGSEVSRCC
jgi:hypothetical protein